MVKKSVFVFLVMAMMVGVFSGICFAGENDAVVYDTDYPQWGFHAHSWFTDAGSGAVAHTQIIESKTGKVLQQTDTKIDYVNVF
ncbi:MAG: hypothetical protein P4N59_08365 [Negativicutes bacterium]|nr:hypothetical protein [Negativicutes bacterium]